MSPFEVQFHDRTFSKICHSGCAAALSFYTTILDKHEIKPLPCYPISMKSFQEIFKAFDTFILSSHVDPDGDGLGGCLGLQIALQNAGKEAFTVLTTPFAERYRFLPESAAIKLEIPPELSSGKRVALITVDAPNLERIGFAEGLIETLNPFIVNLDHHTSNEGFGDFQVIDEKASSSCEVIYDLLMENGLPLNQDISTCLYCGILTDTGRFRFSNTRSQTLKAAGVLLENGADHNKVVRVLYEDKPYSGLLLEAEILNTLCRDQTLAWMHCTPKMIKRAGHEDTEGFINRLTELEGIEVALLFKEIDSNTTKVSLRAVNHIDVNEIAAIFSGGGHAKAAGARLNCDLNTAINTVIAECRKALSLCQKN